MIVRAAAVVAVLASAFAASASAQTVLHHFYGHAGESYGIDVAATGDVDRDGRPDFAVGTLLGDVVEIRSGLDGHVIHRLEPDVPGENQQFGKWLAGGGQVDGDGIPDLALTHRFDVGGGSVRLYSGADASLLLVAHGLGDITGSSPNPLAFVGDVNGDGADDVLLGFDTQFAPLQDTGTVRLISGADGAVLYTDVGTSAFDHLGYTVAGPGDLDDDGVPDFAYVKRFDALGNAVGVLRVVSGRDFHVLWERVGPSVGSSGWSIGAAGDGNGDSVPDLAVWSDTLQLISGVDGSTLWTAADHPQLTNSSVDGGADVDGDGRPDVIAQGLFLSPGGRVRVFSGLDGSPLWQADPSPLTSGELARSIALLGDLGGDGTCEVLVGAPGMSKPNVPFLSFGGATVFSADPSPWGALGGGVAGASGIPVLTPTGTPSPNGAVTIELSGARPNSSAMFVIGAVESSLPFKNGVVVPAPHVVIGGLDTGPLGGFVANGRWPAQAKAGFTLWIQLWVADPEAPAGFAATGAITGTTR